MQQAIRRWSAGRSCAAGKVKLDIPPLIENGNSVPLAVTVESPMTQADHVKAIHVLNEKNPQPNVVCRPSRAARRPCEHHYARPARRHANGHRDRAIERRRFWVDRVPVVVTLSACLEDGLI